MGVGEGGGLWQGLCLIFKPSHLSLKFSLTLSCYQGACKGSAAPAGLELSEVITEAGVDFPGDTEGAGGECFGEESQDLIL